MKIWDGSQSLAQWGGMEYVGQGKPGPPVSERVTFETARDGVTPPKGFSKFMRIEVRPGDQYFSTSGFRTLLRQHPGNSIVKKHPGDDSTYVWCVRFPAGFPGAANIWVAGREWHHDGGKVAPSHNTVWPDHFNTDVRGGPEANAHTYVNANYFQGYAHDEWYTIVERYRHNPNPNGAYELWGARCSTDKEFTKLVNAPGIGTMYDDFLANYLLYGLYASTSLQQPLVMYTAGAAEFTTSAEALAYAQVTLTGSVVPPPPPPPPPVVTPQELRDQAVAELKQTTVGYVNKNWKVPPPGTHWKKALDILDQIT